MALGAVDSDTPLLPPFLTHETLSRHVALPVLVLSVKRGDWEGCKQSRGHPRVTPRGCLSTQHLLCEFLEPWGLDPELTLRCGLGPSRPGSALPQGQLLGTRRHLQVSPGPAPFPVRTFLVHPGDAKPWKAAVTTGWSEVQDGARSRRGKQHSRPPSRRAGQCRNAARKTLASGKGRWVESKQEIRKGLLAGLVCFCYGRAGRMRTICAWSQQPCGPSNSPSPDDHRSWARPCSWLWLRLPAGPCGVGGTRARGSTLVCGSPRPASLGRPLSWRH